jgi:formylglycine-generating enzyme required for sulfatase activity
MGKEVYVIARPMVVMVLDALFTLASIVLCQDTPNQRLAEPTADAQKQSEKLIRDLFKEEYAKRTTTDQHALAKKLLQQGIDTKDDSPTKYVLFREAREIAAKFADVETALAAIAETAKHYEIDGLALKAKILIAMVAGAKSPDTVSILTDACLNVVDEAIQEEKYDIAKILISKAEMAAKAAKDASKTVIAQKKGKEIEDIAKESQKAEEASKILEINPADPDASLALGRYLLMKGDLEKALTFLAKGSDALLRMAAEKELAASVKPEDQAAAGDAWWEVIEKERNMAFICAVLDRARNCYKAAVIGLSGITKTKVEKRLMEIDTKASKMLTTPGSAGVTKARLILDLGGGVRMEMVYVKPGVFVMGGKEAPTMDWQRDERPSHKVEITRGFYIGKYEVTQAQWETVMGSNPSHWKGPDLPVEMVSWEDCQNFMKRLNENTKYQLKGHVIALPTEAQWEYACRAGTTTRWSFGDNETAMGEHGWYNSNSGGQTHPVGQKKANPWGLFDMHGNVWEWCQDSCRSYGGDARDPEGPISGQERCRRGGSWFDSPIPCRSTFRNDGLPTHRDMSKGFRACMR